MGERRGRGGGEQEERRVCVCMCVGAAVASTNHEWSAGPCEGKASSEEGIFA